MTKWFKLSFLTGLLLLGASSAFGQGSLYTNIAWRYTPAGVFPAGGATVTICTASATGTPCTPTVTVYSNSALTIPVANPLPVCTTSPQFGCIDGLGNFSFYASTTGPYTYTITGPGLSAYGPIPMTASLNPGVNVAFTGNNTHSGMETFTGPLAQTGTATPVTRSYASNQAGLTSFYVDWARPSCTGPAEVGFMAAFSVHAEDTPTYDATLSSGTPCQTVALFPVAKRSGTRTDQIWALNPVVAYTNAGSVQGIEVDVANSYQNFTVGGADTNAYNGLSIVTQGAYSPDKAFAVDSTGIAGMWRRGIYLNAITDRAIEFNGTPTYALYADNNMTNYIVGTWSWQSDITTHPIFSFIPKADDTNTELYGTNAANNTVKWSIDNSGNFSANKYTSTIATGTAPFSVASTTNVANLNASSLNGATFAAPGAIGGGTPSTGAFTTLTGTTFNTTTNCAAVGTAASPSVASCGSAAAGHFSCATNATGAICTVNTTAVKANSEIFVFESDTTVTGTALGVTCNTGTNVLPASRLLASSVAATSFTINLGTVTTNPACFSYWIVN